MGLKQASVTVRARWTARTVAVRFPELLDQLEREACAELELEPARVVAMRATACEVSTGKRRASTVAVVLIYLSP